MKLNLRHLCILLAILLASIGFGLGFDAIATAIERNTHPRPAEFAAMITENAEAFGVPEAVLWATVKVESDFASNSRGEDGGIGLFHLTPEELAHIQETILEEPAQDPGMLYDPATNLRSGAAYLSALYRRYGVWETVFAAWEAGCDTVDTWLRDTAYSTDGATLTSIPDASVEAFVGRVTDAQNLYTKLYY